MFAHLNPVATTIFVAFFVLVTVLGFVASRWKPADLGELHEWGLGGRQFGAVISWFLMGGDLYTAYTVIAVPALVYGLGAFGFFAVPYAAIANIFLFLAFPRLWRVAHKRGYVTASDFVLGRYGNRWLELAVALTGIIATMPYIALQLVGIQRVILALGFTNSDVPLAIAFVILAAYTYSSGLRAPAMIAFVKDVMIYIFVIAAVIIIPMKLGGYGAIFHAAGAVYAKKGGPTGLLLKPAQMIPFFTLALGSSFALFMYPHSMTGVLSTSGPRTVRRTAIGLPAYSLVLGLIALMGLMAHAAGIVAKNPQDVVPLLFLKMFPSWFVGFSFAAIAIAALVPAAIMSIGAANTFTRNIWKPFIHPTMDSREEATLAKLVSLLVKAGALMVIFFMPTAFAINLQLLGGMWMVQIFPAIIFGLWTRWFNGWALLAGWAAGMVLGTYWSHTPAAWVPVHAFPALGFAAYNGISALVVNLVIAVVLSAVLPRTAPDETMPADYVVSTAD